MAWRPLSSISFTLFQPQIHTRFLSSSAKLCPPPAAIAVNLTLPLSCTLFKLGTGAAVAHVANSVVLVFPSWYTLFQPQAHTTPSSSRAKLCPPPAEIAVNLTPLSCSFFRLGTRAAVGLFVRLASPSWQTLFQPQAHTRFWSSRAKL